jgi:CheY-like chemotaxis protein
MEAVGRLAGGVAHDFNNAIGVVAGYSSLLKERLAGDETAVRYADEISKAGNRAAALTRQLLAFSRKQVIQPTILDLNSLLTETEKMLRRLIGEDVEINIVRGAGLGRVKADVGQVEQVVLNLAINARDAMPQGGKLTIETGNAELDETIGTVHANAKPGRYVMLSVSDTGCGMDRETLNHIFEPFFTTKGPTKGTGLGLSTVYAIVEKAGGYIWVYSEPGKGARFKVYLPLIEDAAQPLAAGPDQFAAPRGTETILLVEDEEQMRVLMRTCLERGGYTVLHVPHGEAAIQMVSQHDGPIHMLLTDVVMPGINGRELAQSLSLSRPEMKVLYISGYTADLVAERGILQPEVAVLEKPFTKDALLWKVHEVLHSARLGKSTGAGK